MTAAATGGLVSSTTGTPASGYNFQLRPYARRLEYHALRPIHHEDLKGDIFQGLIRIGLGANADETIAQPPLERAQGLPLQTVDGIAGRMGLRDRDTGQLLAGVVVVADGAAQVELTLSTRPDRGPLLAERRQSGVVRRGYRHPARLVGDESQQRQQVPAFRRKGLGLLVGRAAEPDAALEIDRLVAVLQHRGIARRDALHVGDGMAVGARLVGGTRWLGPELLTEL